MQISVSKQIERIIEDIHALPEQTQQAGIYALNRTAEWLKKEIAKGISKEKRVELKMLRDRMVIMRANKRNLQAGISCLFNAIYVKNLKDVHQTPLGVMANGILYPHAFIATLKRFRKSGVYRRTTKKRFPVKSVTTPFFEEATRIIDELLGTEARRIFEWYFFYKIKGITGAI